MENKIWSNIISLAKKEVFKEEICQAIEDYINEAVGKIGNENVVVEEGSSLD